MTELVHLLVADGVFRRLAWDAQMRPGLYLGAIAPDAHRATTGVPYRDVHFRSAHRSGHRLVDFLREYLRPAIERQDEGRQAFFAGWLTHICADDIWRQKIRGDLAEMWQRINGGSRFERESLRDEFYDECDCVDQQLYQRNANLFEDIRWLLAEAQSNLSVAALQPADIHRWRLHVVEELLPPSNYRVTEPRLLSLSFVQETITQAEEEALALLEWELKRAAKAETEAL